MSKKEIPALTKSGGLLSKFGGEEVVEEYRVWFHYHDGRSDEYYVAADLEEAWAMQLDLSTNKEIAMVEAPLAVVWDKKRKDYGEVCIDGIDY